MDNHSDDTASRFFDDLENALMAAALAATTHGKQRNALLSRWLIGTFNAAAYGLKVLGIQPGILNWEPDGEGQRLVYLSPTGLACALARVYEQPNGSWAALVVAGVADHLLEAIGRAEWAVARLTA